MGSGVSSMTRNVRNPSYYPEVFLTFPHTSPVSLTFGTETPACRAHNVSLSGERRVGDLDASGEGDAPVDHEVAAGHPCRIIGQQERHDGANVLGHAKPLQRVLRRHVVLAALVQRFGEPRLHDGRGHGIDPDVRAEFHREFLGDMDQRGLRSTVEADHGGRHDSRDGGDIDDRAAVVGHPRVVDLLQPRERRKHVDLEYLFGCREVHIDHPAIHRVDTRVVDEEIDAAKLFEGLPDGIRLVFGIVSGSGHVERVVRTQTRYRFSEGFGFARGNAHLCAVGHEAFGDTEADSPACAGDNRDLPVEALALSGACPELRRRVETSAHERRSMTSAMPIPPPTHMVSRPNCLSWCWSELMSVVAIRAPVMPNG